ncbi:MAG: hypothetical protein DRJ49_06025 [Thermoprotei archaeon]|nr:MAG: hypothetical protein DRN53_04250 [Thermoprotei archaeon]RLE87744.1 MAG: hypothetical protein DRJ49_06025 [Thermoprotei archaeon]
MRVMLIKFMKSKTNVEINKLSDRSIDYLLKIFELGGYENNVKIGVLANELNLAKPTVSLTTKKLVKKGLLEYTEYGRIRLTQKGMEIVYELLWRHGVLELAFHRLGLSTEESCFMARKVQSRVPRELVEKLWILLGLPNKCCHDIEFPSPNQVNKDKKYLVCTS